MNLLNLRNCEVYCVGLCLRLDVQNRSTSHENEILSCVGCLEVPLIKTGTKPNVNHFRASRDKQERFHSNTIAVNASAGRPIKRHYCVISGGPAFPKRNPTGDTF